MSAASTRIGRHRPRHQTAMIVPNQNSGILPLPACAVSVTILAARWVCAVQWSAKPSFQWVGHASKPSNRTDNGSAARVTDLHFGHFSAIPEYRQVNRDLVARLLDRVPNPFVHLDVATGAGLIPQLIIEAATARGYSGRVIALDRNKRGLEIARQAVRGNEQVEVTFVHGDARDARPSVEELLPPDGVDSVSIHDAIHEIEGEKNQRRVFNSLADVARSGAFLSINSSFTSTSMAIGHSMRGHGEWKLHFMRLTGAKRERKIETLAYRSHEDYKQMIQDAGFRVVHEEDREVILTKTALKAIARYPEFVRGMAKDLTFPRDVSLAELSDAMSAAVDRIRFDFLPRLWYGVIAQKVGSESA